MPNKRIVDNDIWYFCSSCNKSFTREANAVECEKSHNLMYIPLSQSDLSSLIQFIYVKDEKLLTPSLMRTLMKYNTLRQGSQE